MGWINVLCAWSPKIAACSTTRWICRNSELRSFGLIDNTHDWYLVISRMKYLAYSRVNLLYVRKVGIQSLSEIHYSSLEVALASNC